MVGLRLQDALCRTAMNAAGRRGNAKVAGTFAREARLERFPIG